MDEDGSRFETRRKPNLFAFHSCLFVRWNVAPIGTVPFQSENARLHSRPFAVAIRGANSTQRRIQVMVDGARMWAE
jgi:hypothetical protein